MNWVEKLKVYNEGKPHKSPAENDRDADVEFLRLIEEERSINEKNNPSYKAIPKFFFKKPKEKEDSLFHRVR